jgi:hypothetical protein
MADVDSPHLSLVGRPRSVPGAVRHSGGSLHRPKAPRQRLATARWSIAVHAVHMVMMTVTVLMRMGEDTHDLEVEPT